MAIIMDDPSMGVFTFWNSTTGGNVEVASEEPMHNSGSPARATDHSSCEDLIFTALSEFAACGGGTKVVGSGAVWWWESRALVATQSFC